MPAQPKRAAPDRRRQHSAAVRSAGLALVFLLALAPAMTPALAQDTPDQPAAQDDSTPADMSAPTDQSMPADSSAPGLNTSQPATPPQAQPATATGVAAPVTGQILVADDFHDASAGVLPTSAANSGKGAIIPPGSFSLGYVGGAYEFKKLQTAQDASAIVQLPTSYSNVSIDVDTQFTESNANTSLWLTCRVQYPNGLETGYRATARPDNGTFTIFRFDSGMQFFLLGETFSDKLMRSPATNHLQWSCVGDTISFAVNGTVVWSGHDATYATGVIRIGTRSSAKAPDTLHLGNLVVTQR